MELASSGLSPSTIERLIQCGFRCKQDFEGCSMKELAQETKLSLKQSATVFSWIGDNQITDSAVSVLDIVQSQTLRVFSTQINSLDDILGGGIALGELTEIAGVPGIGKSQFAIQAALTVQLAPERGGVNGEAVFIDTEGSFMIQRVVSMATSIAKDTVERDALLHGIHYFRVHDYQELYQVVRELTSFLEKHPKIKLVLIDSIAFHFRHEFEDMQLRARCLNTLSVELYQLAQKHTMAIVLTNQVTTKFDPTIDANVVNLVPALGDTWSHCVTNRIVFRWQNRERIADLIKSPYRKKDSVSFQVTHDGVRDTADNTLKRKSSSIDINPI